MVLLGLGAAWGAAEMFNPDLPNALIGIFGFKAYFFYVPLIFLLPACFETDAQLNAFLRRYCLIAIPVAIIGIFQFVSSPSSAINAYATGGGAEADVITFGSSQHVRVTGTFAFITGYTSYLIANSTLLLAVLGASRWRFVGNRKLYLALGLSLLGMLMTGSRGPIYNLALMFPFYWYLAVMRERDAPIILSRVGFALGVVFAGIFVLGRDALTAFIGRASGATDVGERLMTPFLAPIHAMPRAGILGFGIGSTHQMAMALAPSIMPFYWLKGANTELETGKVMLELGPLGFLLIFLVRLLLVGISFHFARSLHTRFHRALATGAFLFFFSQAIGSVVFDVTCGVYYWFFAGLMMLAARLDRDAVHAQRSASQLAAAPTRLFRPPRRATVPSLPGWSSRPAPGS
jgi:hypothetical protein